MVVIVYITIKPNLLKAAYTSKQRRKGNTRTLTLRFCQYLTHPHSHITQAVAAMDSCFVLVRTHQHGIVVR